MQRRTLWGIVVATAVVALTAGCNGDGDSSSATPTVTVVNSNTPTAIPTDTPTATPVQTVLRGQVSDEAGEPLAGAMITAYDDQGAASVTVFTGAGGRYDFPPIAPGSYRLRARRIGWEESFVEDVEVSAGGAVADFTLNPTTDLNSQLPPIYFSSLLEWPSARVKGDFTRACANCHQIGDHRWRRPRTYEEWEQVVDRMIGYGGIPFFEETREVLLDTLASTFSPAAPEPHFEVPPPPSGDAVRAVIYEWVIDPERNPSCHDLEIGADGTVYTVGGVWALDPRTGERASYPVEGTGGHSIEPDENGDMWITAPGPEQIIKFDVESKEFTYYDQPRIGDDLGSYPHTLRFDDAGRIWYTLSRSNHVCRFDPPTAEFTYYQLPVADPAISGVPVPVAYGCDVAPDQTVWWSQLFGHKIGRVDPISGEVTAWQPPFDGPRRLRVGPDNLVWVPGYGSGDLGRFDPATETWKVYKLPTQPVGHELPYATAVNRHTGDVWITGSNSDTLIRFRPDTEEFTVFPLPTASDFTREIEFDDDDNAWTCTAAHPIGPDTPGTGRIIKIEIRERVGVCGDGVAQLGEECDDGNEESCDGCFECVVESGERCGDDSVNEACGEECDPPGSLCTDECQRVPVCGDGLIDGAEECDDGNEVSCDGCSAGCAVESGCGDGVRCGAEECDDGNEVSCDGCSECVVEAGAQCGDGLVNEACGEECDPPGDGCSLICTSGDGVLGMRRITFGGSFFSSSLGVEVPLGTLDGELDLLGGVIDADGAAPVDVVGPVFYSAAILGGQFGTLCVRIDSCAGFVDCDGGTPVDTLMVQDSNGAGISGLPVELTTGLGEDGPAGAVQLDCEQTFVQLDPGQGEDCLTADYPPAGPIAYTTGEAEAFFLHGNPKVGNGAIATSGEPFDCPNWGSTDGPGQLVATYMVEEDPRAGDVANVNVLDD